MNKNNRSKSVFNNFQKETKYGSKIKHPYTGPFMTEFGDEIYPEQDSEIEVCEKTRKINTSKENDKNSR